MSCGLGAVILIFLILKHGESLSPEQKQLLEKDIQNIEQSIEQISAGIDQKNTSIINLESQIVSKEKSIKEASNRLIAEINDRNKISEENRNIQKASNEIKNSTPDFVDKSGDGERQYLTGLKIEGKRIVYLLDTSASMLDESVQKIFRLSMMTNNVKQNSEKWIRTQNILTWLVARLPKESQFTIITFNDNVKSHSANNWIGGDDGPNIVSTLNSAMKEVPVNGTNLEKALLKAKSMSPIPDAVYIITDGLPTLGESVSGLSISLQERNCLRNKARITPVCRHTLFQKAKNSYFKDKIIKTSTILLPLEGDRRAASDYWNLALQTGGTSISPSRDWP
jgi:hypothetical protein